MLGYLSDPIVQPLTDMIHSAESNIEFSNFGNRILLPGAALPLANEHDFSIPSLKNPLRGFRSKSSSLPSADDIQSVNEVNTPGFGERLKNRLLPHVETFMDLTIRRSTIVKYLSEFDILHLQSLFGVRQLRMLTHFQHLPPIVVSLWGSDVLRCADMERCKLHQQVLRRARFITATGVEFKQITLAKYGRDLAPKMRETYFSPNSTVMKKIVATSESTAKEWLTEYVGFSLDGRKIVCLGHNGTEANQHLSVLKQLSQLSDQEKNEVVILCPMTYGGTPAYKDVVRNAISNAGFTGVVLRDQIPEPEMAFLRKASDLFIFVPISDSFSASVTQALTAGSVTIVGSWLPYASRRRAGFQYHEVDDLSDLPDLVSLVLRDFPTEVESASQNQQLGFNFFNPTKLGQEWCDVYHEASDG